MSGIFRPCPIPLLSAAPVTFPCKGFPISSRATIPIMTSRRRPLCGGGKSSWTLVLVMGLHLSSSSLSAAFTLPPHLLPRSSTVDSDRNYNGRRAPMGHAIQEEEDDHDMEPTTCSTQSTTTIMTRTTRTSFLSTLAGIGTFLLGSWRPDHALAAADSSTETSSEGLTVFQLPSGIKYLELQEGSGPTPEYGQLCSIAYKGYIKLPANKKDANPKPQQFDQSSAYLIKHGNGRTIAGLDEGLHTIKVGGTRRIIIPPKLGYVTSGIGPIPEYPWDRAKLNSLLDQMVALRGGTVVFEVTLLSAMDDEADQGYYQDGSLSPEQFDKLRESIQQRAAQAAQAAAEQVADASSL